MSSSSVAAPSAKRLAKSSGLYSVATLSRSFMGLAVVPFLVATLPSHEFGLVMLVMPLWWIGQPLLSLGASEGLSRAVSTRDPKTSNGALLLSLIVVVPMTLVVGVIIWQFSSFILGVRWETAICLAIIAAGAQSFFACMLVTLQGQGRIGQAVSVLFTFAFAPQVGGVTAVLAFDSSAEAYLAGYLVGMTFVVLVGLTRTIRSAGLQFGPEARATLLDGCKVGLPMTPQMISVQVADVGARRVVLALAGLSAVGVFGVAAAVGNLVWNLIKSSSQAWSPMLFKLDETEVAEFVRKTYAVGTAAALTCWSLGMLALPVVELVLPAGYDRIDFTASAAAFLASAPAGIGFVVASGLCLRYRRTGIMAWASPVIAVVVIGFAIGAASTLGWPAAGASLAIMYALSAPVLAHYVRNFTTSSHKQAYRACAFAIVGGILAGVLRHEGLALYYAFTGALALVVSVQVVLTVRELRTAHG